MLHCHGALPAGSRLPPNAHGVADAFAWLCDRNATPEELRRLLRQRERAKVDFKRELSTRSKDEKAAFVKDVIALTNSPTNTQGGDGRLVVGIDDETY